MHLSDLDDRVVDRQLGSPRTSVFTASSESTRQQLPPLGFHIDISDRSGDRLQVSLLRGLEAGPANIGPTDRQSAVQSGYIHTGESVLS